jgi:peptidyl-prolyl cis-trans isomerase SurA
MKFYWSLFAAVALFCIGCFPLLTAAQDAPSADKILAVVGRNRIVLQSELEQNILQLQQQNNVEFTDSMRCQMLQQIVMQKMFVEQAERDSLLVSDEEVEGNIDNKLRYYTRMYGSREKLEEAAGKTIYQLKDEQKDNVREQLMAEKMQAKLLEHVKITPADVQHFFNNHPQDSLPFYPATIEVGQIVIDPPTSPELDKYAYDQLADIRKQIVTDGKSFETMAGLYSQDPGSRDNGGFYAGVTRDGGFAQEFVSAAFRLQNGEVSPIIKTQFGYHIIQMVKRKGEQVDIRHILIMPQHTAADYQLAMQRLDSVRAQIVAGKLSFAEAVGKYSTDKQSQMTGGMIADPRTNSTSLEVDQLDPALVLGIDSLKPGSISQPQMFRNAQGEQSSRIVFLKSRTEPHKANLKDDYSKIQAVALSQKQNKYLESWIEAKLPTYYLKINKDYADCPQMKRWVARTASR